MALHIIASLRAHIRQALQDLLIRLNRIAFFRYLSTLYYRKGVALYAYVVLRIPGIRGICTRNSFSTKEWIPWESDIDLTVVLKDSAEHSKEAATLKTFWQYHKILSLFLPFIKHISILRFRECSYPALFEDPTLTYLLRNMRVLRGLRASDFPLSPKENIYALRLQDWLNALERFHYTVLPFRIYLRMFERFFLDFISLLPQSEHTQHLKDLLSKRNTYSRNDRVVQFACKGFYHANKIIAVMRESVVKHDTSPSQFKSVIIPDSPVESLISQVREFSQLLQKHHDAISGIYIDAGSLCFPQPRLWVVVRTGIDEVKWLETIQAIRSAGIKALSKMTRYIFDEATLEVLLRTQQQWIFEKSHLLNHAVSVMGENCFRRMQSASDALVFKMVLSNIASRRIGLRNLAFYAKRRTLFRFACEIVRLKVLMETHTIVTTSQELSVASKELREKEKLDSLTASILNTTIPREVLYVQLNILLDELQKKLESASIVPIGGK